MHRTWLTLIIIVAGGFYLWPGDEAPPKSSNTQLSTEADRSAYPRSAYPNSQPVYGSAPGSQQGLYSGIIPPAGYRDSRTQNNYSAQAEYQYRQPQNSLPTAPNGQSQVYSTQSGYLYGQQSPEQIRTAPRYQSREAYNQPPTMNSYLGQPYAHYSQDQGIERPSFYQGTPGFQHQPDVAQPNMGWQQPSGFIAQPAGNSFSENQFNQNYQRHRQKPRNPGYRFRPLENNKSGPKRWTGNYRQNPRTRHYSSPPTRNPYSPQQYPSPWQQPDQLHNNNSLWAATGLPLRQQ